MSPGFGCLVIPLHRVTLDVLWCVEHTVDSHRCLAFIMWRISIGAAVMLVP